jgi:hypothetical protein
MILTRASIFTWLAFALFVLAALSGGKIILTSDFDWLLAGGAASFVLAGLVP